MSFEGKIINSVQFKPNSDWSHLKFIFGSHEDHPWHEEATGITLAIKPLAVCCNNPFIGLVVDNEVVFFDNLTKELNKSIPENVELGEIEKIRLVEKPTLPQELKSFESHCMGIEMTLVDPDAIYDDDEMLWIKEPRYKKVVLAIVGNSQNGYYDVDIKSSTRIHLQG